MRIKLRAILTSALMIALLGATAATAQADRDGGHGSSHGYGHGHGDGHGYHNGYGHGHGRSYGRGYGYVYSGWGYPGYGWRYPPAYWGGYGPGYGYGSLGIGYGWGGHHDSWGLALSLPLYFGPRYYPPPAAVPAPYGYIPYGRPAARTIVRATDAAPDCRQTREYQTEIVVGDQKLPAYGTVCLQADGSWKIISGPTAAE